MKRNLLHSLFCALLLLVGLGQSQAQSKPSNDFKDSSKWSLIFEDEFNGQEGFDATKWSYSPRWNPAWAKFLTQSEDYVKQGGGSMLFRMDNKSIEGDPISYHSGGIQTSKKFSFQYGKVEVRAKFNQGKGSWPAIWMMPEVPHQYGDWPKSGEIDIMEHVNTEAVVHQTIHSERETNENGASKATIQVPYNADNFNTYGIIWDAEKIEFFVNDALTYTYHKSGFWPFDKPFYLILNQSGGAGWPGAIIDADLPFEMQVDYVRVYQIKK